MKTIYFLSICEDNVGEVQGFFDEAGNVVDFWSCNDANWRGEYFDGLLSKLGYDVKYPKGKKELELTNVLRATAAKEWGI